VYSASPIAFEVEKVKESKKEYLLTKDSIDNSSSQFKDNCGKLETEDSNVTDNLCGILTESELDHPKAGSILVLSTGPRLFGEDHPKYEAISAPIPAAQDRGSVKGSNCGIIPIVSILLEATLKA
jgi:hypothetical protein